MGLLLSSFIPPSSLHHPSVSFLSPLPFTVHYPMERFQAAKSQIHASHYISACQPLNSSRSQTHCLYKHTHCLKAWAPNSVSECCGVEHCLTLRRWEINDGWRRVRRNSVKWETQCNQKKRNRLQAVIMEVSFTPQEASQWLHPTAHIPHTRSRHRETAWKCALFW